MATAHAEEECKTKKCKLLLSEFQAGIWSCNEYWAEMHKLEGSSTSAATHSPSPDWDIDANGSLPQEISDEGSDD